MNKHLLFILFISPIFSKAQTTQLDYQPSFTALIVSEMERSTQWYSSVFDLQVMSQVASEERGFRIANLQSDAFQLELIELQNAVHPQQQIPDFTTKTRVIGFFKVGFQVADFDQWMEHLEEQNVTLNGSEVTDPQTGRRMVVITDPDGNRIQFFEK